MPEVAKSAKELCGIAGLGEEAIALLRNGMPQREYMDALIEQKRFPDAVRFLAHALPKREAVWWAWVCARRAAGPNPAPAVKKSLEATEKWLVQPNEENRRSAMKVAQEAQLETPAGCAGLAAFLSGGSLGPPEAPQAPPAEDLTAKAVAGTILLAAVSTEPEQAASKFQTFLGQGMEVVKRIGLW